MNTEIVNCAAIVTEDDGEQSLTVMRVRCTPQQRAAGRHLAAYQRHLREKSCNCDSCVAFDQYDPAMDAIRCDWPRQSILNVSDVEPDDVDKGSGAPTLGEIAHAARLHTVRCMVLVARHPQRLFLFVKVRCTAAQQIDDALLDVAGHYLTKGTCDRLLAKFDEYSPAGRVLVHSFDWETADTIDPQGRKLDEPPTPPRLRNPLRIPTTFASGLHTVPPGHKTNLETLIRAAGAGDLALTMCTDVATGAPVCVVTAVQRAGDDSISLVPLACMFDGNPYAELCPPFAGDADAQEAR